MGARLNLAMAVAVLLTGSVPGPAAAQRAGGTVRAARADFADMAKGTYSGDILSDARGAPRSGVRLVVTKVGPNLVRVASDHPRLPAFTTRLTRAGDSLRNLDGGAGFTLELSTSPRTLKVTVDDASWAGTRE